MKRKLSLVSNILFAAAAVLSLVAGINFNSIKSFSQKTVDGVFPVSYDVIYLDDSSAHTENATVIFNGELAVISSDGVSRSVQTSQAIFTCTNPALRSQNIVRAGMLSMLLLALASLLSALLVWCGFSIRGLAAERRVKAASRPLSAVNTVRGKGARAAATAA